MIAERWQVAGGRAAGVGFVVVLAGCVVLAGAHAAKADPTSESVLPADGVVSIEQVAAGEWTASFAGAPSEVKVISAPQAVLCGVNYPLLGACSTSVSFTWTHGDCIYLQVDGIAGENSSDPYVCRPVVVTTPSASSTPSASATSTPEPTGTPSPTPSVTLPAPVPSPSATATGGTARLAPASSPPPTESFALGTAPREDACVESGECLAATGFNPLAGLLAVLLLALGGLGLLFRARARMAEVQRVRSSWRPPER